MRPEPRIRVSAILRWHGRILLCRHEKRGSEHWLLPGGGVQSGESLTEALAARARGGDRSDRRRATRSPSRGPSRSSTRSRRSAASGRSTSSTSSSRVRSTARSPTSSHATRPCAATGCSSATSSRAWRCTRRSTASCGASSPATRASTSGRCGRGSGRGARARLGRVPQRARPRWPARRPSGGRTRHARCRTRGQRAPAHAGGVGGGTRPRRRAASSTCASKTRCRASPTRTPDVEVVVAPAAGPVTTRAGATLRRGLRRRRRHRTRVRRRLHRACSRSLAAARRGAVAAIAERRRRSRRRRPLLRRQGSDGHRVGAAALARRRARRARGRRLRGERSRREGALAPLVRRRRGTRTSSRFRRRRLRSRRTRRCSRCSPGCTRRPAAPERYLARGGRHATGQIDAPARPARPDGSASAAGPRAPGRDGMREPLELVGERLAARRSRRRARAHARAASRRAPGCAAAAGRGGTSRSPRRRGSPRSPSAPSFPWPATTRPSGVAPGSSSVRPAWFSKPATVDRDAVAEIGLEQHVADQPPLAGDASRAGSTPAPGIQEPSRPR